MHGNLQDYLDNYAHMKTAILLSGGIDSIALAFWKRSEVAYTVDYGQLSASAEIRAASQVCAILQLHQEIIKVDCASLGSGDMAGRAPSSMAPVSEWWPFRNQFLLTVAAMKAVGDDVDQILFGSVKTDATHRDGSEDFFKQINNVLAIQEGTIKVVTPAIEMSSAELVKVSGIDISVLSWAHSCHVSEYACGNCRGCFKHQQVMVELGYEAY